MNSKILFTVKKLNEHTNKYETINIYGPTKQKKTSPKPIKVESELEKALIIERKERLKKAGNNNYMIKQIMDETNWQMRVLNEQRKIEEKNKIEKINEDVKRFNTAYNKDISLMFVAFINNEIKSGNIPSMKAISKNEMCIRFENYLDDKMKDLSLKEDAELLLNFAKFAKNEKEITPFLRRSTRIKKKNLENI